MAPWGGQQEVFEWLLTTPIQSQFMQDLHIVLLALLSDDPGGGIQTFCVRENDGLLFWAFAFFATAIIHWIERRETFSPMFQPGISICHRPSFDHEPLFSPGPVVSSDGQSTPSRGQSSKELRHERHGTIVPSLSIYPTMPCTHQKGLLKTSRYRSVRVSKIFQGGNYYNFIERRQRRCSLVIFGTKSSSAISSVHTGLKPKVQLVKKDSLHNKVFLFR